MSEGEIKLEVGDRIRAKSFASAYAKVVWHPPGGDLFTIDQHDLQIGREEEIYGSLAAARRREDKKQRKVDLLQFDAARGEAIFEVIEVNMHASRWIKARRVDHPIKTITFPEYAVKDVEVLGRANSANAQG